MDKILVTKKIRFKGYTKEIIFPYDFMKNGFPFVMSYKEKEEIKNVGEIHDHIGKNKITIVFKNKNSILFVNKDLVEIG